MIVTYGFLSNIVYCSKAVPQKKPERRPFIWQPFVPAGIYLSVFSDFLTVDCLAIHQRCLTAVANLYLPMNHLEGLVAHFDQVHTPFQVSCPDDHVVRRTLFADEHLTR